VLHQVEGGKNNLLFGVGDEGEGCGHGVMRVRWVRRACREERSRRNLCCLPRGREARAATRPATVSARERASALTNASESRGVPAATNFSGRWAIPRAEATAKPVAADWAYAAHLGREGARLIRTVAVTRSRKASMAASGGPCRCTSSAYATTRMSGNASRTLSSRLCRARAKSRGPQGSPWCTPR
jgi:hypothetical protein